VRVGWYFARAVAAWFFGLCVVVCGLLLAYSSWLPAASETMPSPWSLVGPLFMLATWITWTRARRAGELTAAASGGSGFALCVPVVGLGVVLQALFSIPEGRMPRTFGGGAAIERSVDGKLYLQQRDRGVVLLASGEVQIVSPRLPDGFKPAPHNPQRYRRQAFFSRAPRFGSSEPLDPWVWRWVYIVIVLGVPALLMQARRPWLWWWGALPMALPLLVL
jgi:hypothetical protein